MRQQESFPVPGTGIIITDKEPNRGRMTALLMAGEEGNLLGGQARESAERLIAQGISPDKLDFAINQMGKTPEEAVKYLEDPNNHQALSAEMAAAKGKELPDYFNN